MLIVFSGREKQKVVALMNHAFGGIRTPKDTS
jgi:hypothetical protein